MKKWFFRKNTPKIDPKTLSDSCGAELEAPRMSAEEENKLNLERLGQLAANFDADEAFIVCKALAKTHPTEIFRALEGEFSSNLEKLGRIGGI